MDTNEAIEWIRNIPKINLYIGTKKEHKGKILFTNGVKDCTEKEYYKDIDEIISLLQQGEKYRQIVEEIISSRYFSARDNEYLKSFKQKYFPKEIIKEVVKGITEQIKEGAEIARKEAETKNEV